MNIEIAEGISGVYHYHLCDAAISRTRSLCDGRQVMHTHIPLKAWGIRTHVGESWCKECARVLAEVEGGK